MDEGSMTSTPDPYATEPSAPASPLPLRTRLHDFVQKLLDDYEADEWQIDGEWGVGSSERTRAALVARRHEADALFAEWGASSATAATAGQASTATGTGERP